MASRRSRYVTHSLGIMYACRPSQASGSRQHAALATSYHEPESANVASTAGFGCSLNLRCIHVHDMMPVMIADTACAGAVAAEDDAAHWRAVRRPHRHPGRPELAHGQGCAFTCPPNPAAMPQPGCRTCCCMHGNCKCCPVVCWLANV